MTIYAKDDDTWTEQSAPPADDVSVDVQASDPADRPEVHLLWAGEAFFTLTGAPPRPQTDTTHTVARLHPDAATGTLLFAVHADENDLVFEDLSSGPSPAVDEADLDHVRSALNEIMVPVYIDDVVSDLSERIDGLVLLHTVQYEEGGTWSYFRSSAFEDGTLAFEEEHGSL